MEAIVFLLLFVAFCGFMAYYSSKNQKKLKELGYDKKDLIINSKYTCGHPDIDKPGLYNLGIRNKCIYFINMKAEEFAKIDGDKIKNIIVEDQTTFEKKVTLARMALVGIFAFGLKKKKKLELAYMTIEWSDGRFDHSTIFEYEGVGSVQKANTYRNKLIKAINA